MQIQDNFIHTVFAVLPMEGYSLHELRLGMVVTRENLPPNAPAWAVRINGFSGYCYDHEGNEQHEPSPSNRDEEFYKQCRFTDFDEAMMVGRIVAERAVIQENEWRKKQEQEQPK